MAELSLHHLTMIDASPLELVDAAAAGRFDYCGIRLVAPRPGDPFADIVDDPRAVGELRRRLDDTGVKLLDIEAIWLGPDTDIATLRRPLEVGAGLGARYVLTVGYDEDLPRLADNFGRLCDLAGALRMTVMLEFITYCTIRSLGEARVMVETCGRANAGILVDTLQFFRSGAQPADLDGIPARLFPYMQLCDGARAAPASVEARRREARTDRRLPGAGELPVGELLRHLPRGIPFSLEAPTVALKGLPYVEQGIIAGDAVRAFLAGIDWPPG